MRIFDLMKGRLFYGWWIVVFGSFISAVGTGILGHTFTIFYLPLKRDFAVSSAAISLLYGAARLEGGIESPIVGFLIDRFGPRAMILAGASMAGSGLILLSLADSYWSFFFIYVFIISLGHNAGFFHPLYTVINSWFIRRRGVGFAAIPASARLGAMIVVPILSYIVLNFGWRTGAAMSGLVILIVALPSALIIHRSPEELGLHPDGDPPRKIELQKSNHMDDISSDNLDFTVKEALKTFTYWTLMITISLRVSVTIALNAHFIPILVWRGFSESTGAYLVSLYAFGAIISSLGIGWIGDRWNKSLLSCVCIAPSILVLVGLSLSQARSINYFLPIALSITMGTVPVNWALIGDFFGRRPYAKLRGFMGISMGLGTFFSPIYSGWVFDRTGSYTQVLITFAIILLFVAFSFAVMRPPTTVRRKTD
jgi:sugar phosphate permease